MLVVDFTFERRDFLVDSLKRDWFFTGKNFTVSLAFEKSETIFFTNAEESSFSLTKGRGEERIPGFFQTDFINRVLADSNSGNSLIRLDDAKGGVYISRDVFGRRPVYYVFFPGKILISSPSLRSLYLMCLKLKIDPGLNREVICGYIGYVDNQRTYSDGTHFENIKTVLPGHIATFTKDSFKTESYFKEAGSYPKSFKLFSEYGEEFRHIFEKSVRLATADARHIGGQLSGGLDSSSALSMARNIYPNLGISAFFHDVTDYVEERELEFHDKRYSALVASELNLDYHIVNRESDFFDGARWFIGKAFRPPMMRGSLSSGRSLVQRVKNVGCDILLTGFDGDSVVGYGREYLLRLFEDKDWGKLRAMLPLLAEGLYPWERESYLKILFPEFFFNRLKGAIKTHRISDFFFVLYNAYRHFDVNPGLLLKKVAVTGFQKAKISRRGGTRDIIRRSGTYYDGDNNSGRNYISFYERLLDNINVRMFEEYYALCEGYDIEVKYPFYHTELYELCRSVPSEWNYSNGLGRGIMREGMKGILPEAARLRAIKPIPRNNRVTQFALQLFEQGRDFLYSNNSIWDFVDRQNFEYNLMLLKSGKAGDNDSIINYLSTTLARTIYTAIWLETIKGIDSN